MSPPPPLWYGGPQQSVSWRRVVRGARQGIANYGWWQTARSAWKALRQAPSAPEDLESWQPTAEHAFDREHGTDTSGLILGEELGSGASSDRWNTAYYGIGVSVFHQVMSQVPLACVRGATFLDLGCGKGRALLLAAAYPFREVIGVEIAPTLHQIACANAVSFAAAHPEAPPIRVLLHDAARFELPPGPLVLYLYHPFCRPVLEQVVANLERSLGDQPRSIAVVYINDELRDVLDGAGFLRVHWRGRVVMEAMDRLADRIGSSVEDSTIYLND